MNNVSKLEKLLINPSIIPTSDQLQSLLYNNSLKELALYHFKDYNEDFIIDLTRISSLKKLYLLGTNISKKSIKRIKDLRDDLIVQDYTLKKESWFR